VTVNQDFKVTGLS